MNSSKSNFIEFMKKLFIIYNLQHKNGDKTYWSNGVKVTTKCKKGIGILYIF